MRRAITSGSLTLVLVAGLLIAMPAADAAFPGANGLIAFQTWRDGNGEIYVVRADGSGLTNLTRSALDEVTPAWSPDGTRIAFGRGHIYVMNADGSNVTQLTFGIKGDFPAWSPDGARVAYLGWDNDIHVVDAFGNGADVNLTTSSSWERPPSWSPDGSRIAFGRYDPTEPAVADDIWLMDPDGSDQTQITTTPGFDGLPDWSPDGTRIAFCGEVGYLRHVDILVMDVDGTNRVNLTNSPGASECWPRWSPDGRYLVFDGDRLDPTLAVDIFLMRADGSDATPLVSGPTDDRSPSWQPILDTTIDVEIDVKPGSGSNPVNLSSRGKIPVAVLSTSSFDATTVDSMSVCFGEADVPAERDCSMARSSLEDVDTDGLLDLVLHFETVKSGIDAGDKAACLTGIAFSEDIEGCDSIRTI